MLSDGDAIDQLINQQISLSSSQHFRIEKTMTPTIQLYVLEVSTNVHFKYGIYHILLHDLDQYIHSFCQTGNIGWEMLKSIEKSKIP